MSPNHNERVIGFIDIDAYECQLYQRQEKYQRTRGLPCVVVNSSDRILSSTYEARSNGVTRDLTPFLKDALEKIPELFIFRKPNEFGKPESKTTKAGTDEIYHAISKYCRDQNLKNVIIEVQPSDGFYLDLTNDMDRLEKMHREKDWRNELIEAGVDSYFNNDFNPDLSLGAIVIMDICRHVKRVTGLTSSAGISTNKLVAKMACGFKRNWPEKYTILESGGIFKTISRNLPISKINGLGGDKGEKLLDYFQIENIGKLRRISRRKLKNFFENAGFRNYDDLGDEIFNWARGEDFTPVQPKFLNKKMKMNKPSGDIQDFSKLSYDVENLCQELFSNQKNEISKHQRTFNEFKLDVTFVDYNNNAQNYSKYFDVPVNGVFANSNLANKVIGFITSRGHYSRNDFVISELSFSIQNFIPMQFVNTPYN